VEKRTKFSFTAHRALIYEGESKKILFFSIFIPQAGFDKRFISSTIEPQQDEEEIYLFDY
jgi:hypothetical protein